MAIALANDNVAAGIRDNSSSSTLTVTFTHATTAGNHCLLTGFQSSSQVLSSISDSRGNTWQVDVAYNGANAATNNIASCHIGTGHQIGDTLTLTFGGAGSFSAAVVSEWSGLASSSWLDKTHTGSAASGTPSSGATATRTSANELLFGAAVTVAAGATAGSGFTALTSKATSGPRDLFPEYQIVSSTGTDAATWTFSGAYNAAIATYVASAASPPTNTVAPAVTGTATVGSVLSCTTGTWTDAGSPAFTYQWQRGGVNIGSATSSTYTLVDADDATNVRCVVTDTDANGATAANSNAVAILEPVPTNSVLPAVTGTTNLGDTLTCSTGTWTHQGGTIHTYAYQWQRDDSNIGGATASTRVVAAADQGHNLRCIVTATNSGGAGTPANTSETAVPSAAAATGNLRVLERRRRS